MLKELGYNIKIEKIGEEFLMFAEMN